MRRFYILKQTTESSNRDTARQSCRPTTHLAHAGPHVLQPREHSVPERLISPLGLDVRAREVVHLIARKTGTYMSNDEYTRV